MFDNDRNLNGNIIRPLPGTEKTGLHESDIMLKKTKNPENRDWMNWNIEKELNVQTMVLV